MEGLIRVLKNNLFFLIIIFSCGTTNKPKNNFFGLVLSSVYDNESVTLKLNDSIILNNEKIYTDRSLGIDMKNQISFKSDVILISIETKGVLKVIDKHFERVLKKDTTFCIGEGKFIWIDIRDNNINFKQSKKKFIIE